MNICVKDYKQKVGALIAEDFSENFSLLDVGCRDCALKQWLPVYCAYSGMDLDQNQQNSVAYVQSIDGEQKFEEGAFDAITALDVIEHVDDFEGILDRIVRLAAKRVYITVPNIAHYSFRVGFLRGGKIGSKYTLAMGAGKDRHRWFTVLDETDSFFRDFCYTHGYEIKIIHMYPDTVKSKVISLISRILRLPESLYIYRALYVITKKSNCCVI